MAPVRKFYLQLFVMIAAMVALSSGAGAQQAAPSGTGKSAAGKAPKRTEINFEDQLVEGQTQKPELFYLLQQRDNNFKRLIRLRENFLPEMRKTGEEIGRGRKGTSP